MPLVLIAADRPARRPRKISKADALYIHRPDTNYRCEDCCLWIEGKDRCYLHGKDDEATADTYCGFWAYGKPMPDTAKAQGAVTPEESGLNSLKNGTLCRRCAHFLKARQGPNDCAQVDRNSPGDDPGDIDPEACCAEQKPVKARE